MPPPFFEMNEYDFQDLCCDLFEQEPGISSCEVYGRRGEKQRGVDLIARTSSGGGTEVGQCKCTHHFSAAEVRSASSAFLEHLDFWKDHQVKRFILFVACDLNSTHQQEEVTRQEKLFLKHDIRYEAWSARRIAKQLKPRREIAKDYFDTYWVDRLCGALPVSAPPPSPAQMSIVDEALVRQLESLTSLVSRAASGELDTIRHAWREGRAGEALRRVEGLLGEPSLPAAARSELLLFAARAELERRGPDAARTLLAQVPATVPGAARVAALVEYRATSSPDRALALLSPMDDLTARQLKAGILLEARRFDEAASVLRDLAATNPTDPETLRLSAFQHLLAGHLQQAQLAIAEALEREPRWASLRWAAGMIAYFHSVSPALLCVGATPWPEPVNWHFVRQDDTSLTRLDEAAGYFRDLLATTDTSPDDRRRLETWYLASLANNPERQAEAEAFCRTLFSDQPAHAPAVLWAAARRFDVDLKPSRRALEALAKQQPLEHEQVLALVAIHLAQKLPKRALALLDQERPRFAEAFASRLWAYWRAVALASAKRDALPFLDELADAGGSFEARQARAVALSETAKATGDPQPLLRHLTESFDATSDPAFLFAACAVAAEHSDWAFVAARRQALLDLVGTPDAVRLAAFSAHYTGEHQTCREILDDRREVFRHAKLPTDLRELRVATARQLGALSDALAEAEALERDDPSTPHLMNLASVLLDVGNLKALPLTARKLLGRLDLAPRDALRIARLVYLEDLALAQALWTQATSAPVEDGLVGEAFELASRIGLGHAARPLGARMLALAQAGRAGLWAGGLPDLRQLAEERRRHVDDIDAAYSRAAIPIHLLSAKTGIPLAHLFHGLLADNERDPRPRAQSFLLIRHGGRPVAEISEPLRRRLHLDVTAVLLAAHFEILDAVEGSFRPLRVADDLISALLEMRHSLSAAQPDHHAASEAVLELLDSRELKLLGDEQPQPGIPDVPDLPAALEAETTELLTAAAAANGAFVQFLPMTGRDGTELELPSSIMARVSGPAAVLAALRQSGALPADQYQRALSNLGPSEIEQPGAPLAGAAMPLFWAPGIAERLARLGILAAACRTFAIHIHPREADRLREQVRRARSATTTASWLTALIERIGRGITTGTYEVVVAAEQPAEAPDVSQEPRNHVLHCLQTLLLAPSAPDDVLWIDDRWANSYVARGETPIVGINEVLRALVAAGALRPEDHYAKLARMRAANLGFLPLAADELLHHLAQSRLDDGGWLVETHELRTLRAAVAAEVERFGILQLPATPPEADRHELAAIVNLRQAVGEAIRGAWDLHVPAAQAAAWSDWLIANLHYDYRVIGQFLVLSAAHDEAQAAGLGLGALVSEGFAVRTAPGRAPSRRHEYFAWLDRRVLAPLLGANPAVLVATADYLKRFLLDLRSERPSGLSPDVWDFNLQVFVRDLPPPLLNEIGNDQGFMAALDLTRTPVAVIGGHAFDRQQLMGAFGQVVNGGRAAITTSSSRTMAHFELTLDNAIGLTIGDEMIAIPLHEEVLLLTDSVARRRELLDGHPDWFDCSVAEREAAVASIATEENLMRRVETAESWKRRSAAHFYLDLGETLAKDQHFRGDQLMPSHLEGLLEHLRLERATSLPCDALLPALAVGADCLLREEGLETAVKRLWSLPIPLPASVFAAFPASAEDRTALLDSLLADALTPLEKVHLIKLHLAGSPIAGLHGRAKALTIDVLSQPVVHEWELFRLLLQWILWQLELRDTVTWSPHARLLAAWLHADKLMHTLLAARVPIEELLRSLPAPARLSPASFRISEHASRDAAHPDHTSLPRMVATSIAYAWEGNEPGDALPEIRSQLQGLIGVDSSAGLVPVEELLEDLSLAQNGLGTFLGSDLGEELRSILDAGLAAHLRSAELQHGLEVAVEAIAAQPDLPYWKLVGAILGNLEPPPGIRGHLARALAGLSVGRLLEQGWPVILAGLGAASRQARYFERAVKDHLQQQQVAFAAQVSSLEPAASIPAANLLLLAGFEATMAGETDLTRAAGEFAQQILLLLDVWPGLGPLIAPGLREVCDRLSLGQQKAFAHLLVRLRTI